MPDAALHQQRQFRETYQQLTVTIWNDAQQYRRTNYLLSLAMGPESAKEIRVFGMPAWIVDRYRDAWFTVMGRLWLARQRSWRGGP